MADSTEATVRLELVKTIQAIAQTDLGFDNIGGNVREYLLDYEATPNRPLYLMASCGAKKTLRVWGVMVSGADQFLGSGGLTQRIYNITIRGYYDVGTNGTGINLLLEHRRKIAGAIMNAGTTLRDTVTFIDSPGVDQPQKVSSGLDKEPGEMLVGSITYRATRRAPTY